MWVCINSVHNLSWSQYLLMQIMDLHQRTQCASLKFSNVCLYSLVNASFKNLMDWHTCFLSLLYKNVFLATAPGLPKIWPSSTYLLHFLLPTHHFLSPCHTFMRSLAGPSAHSTFKPWESDVPTPTLWMWVTYQKAVGAIWTMSKEVPKAAIFCSVMLTRPRCHQANKLEHIAMQCPSPTSTRTGAQRRGQITRHANWQIFCKFAICHLPASQPSSWWTTVWSSMLLTTNNILTSVWMHLLLMWVS